MKQRQVYFEYSLDALTCYNILMDNYIISDIHARQVLDSRGNPTVEAEVFLKNGAFGRAIVPSGASTGSGEALELRDADIDLYGGKSVLKAVWNVNSAIRDVLIDNTSEPSVVDQMMCDLDGTPNKSSLGANAILAVSLANAKANAYAHRLPLYKYIARLVGAEEEMSLPLPMMNVMNGGAHAGWSTDFQEYMIIPRSADSISHAVQMGAEVFHALATVLKELNYPTTVGDEGGYAPLVKNGDNEPLSLIREAVSRTKYRFGEDVSIAMDIAASEFYDSMSNTYRLKTSSEEKTAADMIDWYTQLIDEYPIVSIEDGLAENDWSNWRILTEELGDRIQLVGDDLFVTNTELLNRGISEHVANAILIKPNQIGTLTETIDAVMTAKRAGYRTVMSHRSGETEDTTIVHLAVGLGTGQIKTGSLSRSERIAKYNELMRISEFDRTLALASPFSK